jgi:hypothetical protein
MIDPIYTATIIIGGSSHKYAFTALPTELLADQSLDISITVTFIQQQLLSEEVLTSTLLQLYLQNY